MKLFLKLVVPAAALLVTGCLLATVAMTRSMPGIVSSDPEVAKVVAALGWRLVLGFSAFSLLAIVAMFLAVRFWIEMPLTQARSAIVTRDIRALKSLGGGGCDVARLAKAMEDCIIERKTLLTEIESRALAEAALERTETRLKQAQKMEAVGRLAGGVAHDFNNLLTAILGFAGLIQKDAPVDSPVQDYAWEIIQAGEHAGSLTQQMLAFSRQKQIEPSVIDLNELTESMAAMIRRMIGELITLQLRIPNGEVCVQADRTQLQQVLLNLAVNARDAMPQGGCLEVGVDVVNISEREATGDLTAGTFARISFSDDGSGMDSETQAHIFEPFFTTKETGKGTGLGLALVYGIVKQGAGAVAVESKPGEGTTFRIYLPYVDAVADEIVARELSPSETTGGETVLVVEDDEIVRRLVCSVLSSKGYRVFSAENGEDALALGVLGNIDLLLTDVVMPKIGGVELARALHQRRPDAPVLYMSGYAHGDLQRFTEVDMSADVLTKPFGPDVLVRRVRECMAATV